MVDFLSDETLVCTDLNGFRDFLEVVLSFLEFVVVEFMEAALEVVVGDFLNGLIHLCTTNQFKVVKKRRGEKVVKKRRGEFNF